MTEQPEQIPFNGINGATGEYGLALTADELLNLARGQTKPANLEELQYKKQEPFPLRPDLEPSDLSQAGWGIIFHEEADPAIQDALTPLLILRQTQAEAYFKIFAGALGYRTGESKDAFLARHGVGPGLVDPEAGVPYYLLIVGSPGEIPYDFQYQLDVQFAVGRIHFHTLDEYANYANSVVAAEEGSLRLPRQAAFFGVANPDDRATQLSSQHLVAPLLEKLATQNERWAKQGNPWQLDTYLAEGATKAQLSRLINSSQAPALLFTASHGMEFPAQDTRQLPHQGAILCQDWPGPVEHRGPISQDWYFAGDDVAQDANLLGTISFFFACYGAGTPRFNEFAKQTETPEAIAPHDFLAQLPVKMLGLSKGGALAAVGHVERAWGHSIVWPGVGSSISSFDITLRQLMRQAPIGYALEAFNLRYAELATELTMFINRGEQDAYKLTGTWTAHNDARGYIILGDPAVRLAVAQQDETPTDRPVIQVVSRPDASPQPVAAMPTASAPPTPAPQPAIAYETTADLDFGIREMFHKTQGNVSDAVQQFAQRLGGFLSDALDDATSLNIATYTSESLTGVVYDGEKFTPPAELRALTHIKIDGDSAVCVPLKEGEVDAEIWAIHLEMVKQAQASRAELVRTAASALSSLAGVWKIG